MYESFYDILEENSSLTHHGIKGMKWGVRRYQNPDGSLTPEGKKRYGYLSDKYSEEDRKIDKTFLGRRKVKKIDKYMYEGDDHKTASRKASYGEKGAARIEKRIKKGRKENTAELIEVARQETLKTIPQVLAVRGGMFLYNNKALLRTPYGRARVGAMAAQIAMGRAAKAWKGINKAAYGAGKVYGKSRRAYRSARMGVGNVMNKARGVKYVTPEKAGTIVKVAKPKLLN